MAALCRSPAFSSGVAYAVSCLGQQDIVIKEKQSEAITERSVALVISPLVSLMVDQVCSL